MEWGRGGCEMDGNRLFMVGVVVLLLGIQFRVVESFELNDMGLECGGKTVSPRLRRSAHQLRVAERLQ